MNKIINGVVYGFQLVILIALLILEYLSGYKAGVMKHLYFKKMEYLSKVYTHSGMMIHLFIVLLLFIGLVLICKDKWNLKRKLSMIRFVLYSIILISSFYLPYMRELNTFAYILIFLEILIGIESVKLVIYK